MVRLIQKQKKRQVCSWILYGGDTHLLFYFFNRTDGVPSLGWDATISFLILPVLLVVSQFVSMELMQPKTTDSAQQQSNVILKVLPLMIGWFSLNVPAALCVYWFVNNVITTGLSLFIRSTMPPPAAMELNTGSSSSSTTSKAAIFTPPREKPSGFGMPNESSSSSGGGGGIKTLTKQPIVDAEVVVEQSDSDDTSEESSETTTEEPNSNSSKKRGKKKKN